MAAIVLGAHLMLDHLERAREGQADNSILAPVLEPLKLRHRVDALIPGDATDAPLNAPSDHE